MEKLVLNGCSMTADYMSYKNREAEMGLGKYLGYCHNEKKYIEIEWEYTEPHKTPDVIMAEAYGMQPVNLSTPGAGNKQIFNKTVDYIMNNDDIGFVAVCWTVFTRMDLECQIPNAENTDYTTLLFSEYRDCQKNKDELRTERYELWKTLHRNGLIFMEKDVNDFYRYSILLTNLCENLGIPLVQASSIVTTPATKKFLRYFIEHPMMDKIDHENFYGWPLAWELGGKALFDPFIKEHNVLSQYDGHPNARGHEIMAENLMQFIEEREII